MAIGKWSRFKPSASDQRGASMVEYALLVILIAIIAIVAVEIAGTEVSLAFRTVAASLRN